MIILIPLCISIKQQQEATMSNTSETKMKLIIKPKKKLIIKPNNKIFLDKHKKKNSEVMLELLRERKGCKKLPVKIVLDGGVVVRYYYISDSSWALPDW